VLFGNKSQPLLGLDITTSSVKLIELSQSGKRYRVESYSAEPTPPSSVSEKAIVDAKALSALGKLYQLDRRCRDIEAQQWLSFFAEQHVFFLLGR